MVFSLIIAIIVVVATAAAVITTIWRSFVQVTVVVVAVAVEALQDGSNSNRLATSA